MILRPEKEIYNINSEHIVAPELKKVLKNKTWQHIDGVAKGAEKPTERAPKGTDRTIWATE